VKGFSSKRIALKVDICYRIGKYSFQMRACIFQPRNLHARALKGLNINTKKKSPALSLVTVCRWPMLAAKYSTIYQQRYFRKWLPSEKTTPTFHGESVYIGYQSTNSEQTCSWCSLWCCSYIFVAVCFSCFDVVLVLLFFVVVFCVVLLLFAVARGKTKAFDRRSAVIKTPCHVQLELSLLL